MMTVLMATNRSTFGDSRPQESKSASGFTPLPPIRRTSTFDLLSKKLGGDEEDSAPSPVGSSDNEIPPAPPMKEGPYYQNGNGHAPSQWSGGQAPARPNQPQSFMQPPPQQHPAFANGSIHIPNGFAPGSGAPPFNGIQQQVFMGRGGPVGQHPGQIQGQPNAFSMQNGQPFPQMGMGGNPVQRFPPGGQWKLEESHLSEPLNIPHRNRPEASNQPQQQQPGYDPYDKETEEAVPPKIARTRPRNNSNNIPPVSAERFRGLFATKEPEQPQNLSPPQAAPAGHPIFRIQTNESGKQGEQGSRNAGLTKEMEVHIDEIPDPSASGEEQPRRSSGFFGLNNRRNTGAEPGQQDKTTFLSQSGPKTSMWEHDDKPSMKKRLSELRGMIKGVGNAKDGERDDQPTKPSTSYMPRPSMQGPIRTHPGLPGQGPSQSSPLSQPPIGIGRTSTNESRPAGHQHAHSEDEHKKTAGGFLGGLFNKQGPKSGDSRQQTNQPSPPAGQRPPQPPTQPSMQPGMQPGREFRPGKMIPGQTAPHGQPYGPHPMYPPGQPFNAGQPEQQGVRRLMLSGQLNSEDSIQSPTSPQFLGMARAVMMRRPSEITVSSQSQAGGSPGQSSQQGPQTNVRPAAREDGNARTPQKQFGGDGDFSVSGALPKGSPQLSRQNSQERLDVNGSSTATRITPNRKPVGSGFARQDGASPVATKPGASDNRPTSADDERSGQLPSGQQSPTLGKLGHVRQRSLPSPGRSPVPLQPGQVTSPQATGGGQLSPRGTPSAHNQQVASQPHGAPQRQPGVPQSGLGPGPQRDPRNPQVWNPINTFSNPQQLGPSNQNSPPPPPQPPRPTGGPAPPAPTAEQQNAISKFLEKTIGPSQTSKESNQKSAASKFLNAFKRGSKQSEQAHDQQRPPPGHQTPPQLRPQQLSGPQLSMQRAPNSGPSPVPAGPLGPMGNMPQSALQPGQGRGQMLPPQGPLSRGNPLPPPMMYGGGRGVPAHMQPGVSQKPNQILGLQQLPSQQRRASTQRIEPQYDQVPIPRGYEAVHGYGNAGMLAPSPYNVGRPSPPPAVQQFQSFTPQGGPQQPWDPRLAQQAPGPYGRPHMQMPLNQQVLAQSIQRNTDSESSTTPTPSEQGTFLDMTPTPPPRQSHESLRTDRQPTQRVHPQAMQAQISQQPQIGTQSNFQRVQTTETQTPSSSNWGSAPESARSPGKQNPLGHGPAIHAKPSDPNISPPSDSSEVPRSQPQHIALAMNNSPRSPQVVPPESSTTRTRPFSPTGPPSGRLPGVPNPNSNQNQSPPIIQGPEEQPESTTASAGRLVSKMSVMNSNNSEPPRNMSLSPEIIAGRATSVSPEPPGPRSAPYHQVSNNSLNINVDRANDVTRTDAEEDIYDATPRMHNSQTPVQVHVQTHVQDPNYDNTKYAGSERSRPVVNGNGATPMVGGIGAASAADGGAAGAIGGAAFVDAGAGAATVDATATVPEPGSEESTPPKQVVLMNMEPEEKILVDQPVELAAVNDDDGIPAMSATSYPGQEWNPYAAGEFGDWE
ncbi:hypothetical protein GGR53DRAFT_255268 [Hypoxylon sp. FL1150]|nr:hypothetical protein GGR53DRAFT_255268 [Hypoxylon sp. FL1150]